MSEYAHSSHSFFDCLKQTKEEFRLLTARHPELARLSARELEVFDLPLSDNTLSQIAQELSISYSSVHFHCKNIYRKLKLSSRRQLLISYKELYD